MNKEFKKTFFVSLMAVLLVISNLIGKKYTGFMDITIGVDFITFPFTFLCTLLIMDLGSKKDAYRSILVASIIQLLITISYTIAINLGSQSLMPDSAQYVNHLFKVNELNILASVLSFIISHCLLIYIYENFKLYNKELYGLVIGLLGSLFLNSLIYLVITLREYELLYIVNMLLSNVIIDIIMLCVIIILFYILRDKKEKIIISDHNQKDNAKSLSTNKVTETKKNQKKSNNTKSKKSNNNLNLKNSKSKPNKQSNKSK